MERICVPLRTVILVRWNSPDLLKIRVDPNESRKRIEAWHPVAWEFIRSALVRSQFGEWDLEGALKRMVLEREKHGDLYTFRDAGLGKKDVLAQFQAVKAEGAHLKSQTTVNSIKKYMKSDRFWAGMFLNADDRPRALSTCGRL